MARNDPFGSFVMDFLRQAEIHFSEVDEPSGPKAHPHNPTNNAHAKGAKKVREEYERQERARQARSEVVDLVKCTVCGTYFEPHERMVRWNKPGAHSRKKFLCIEHWK